MVAPVVRYETGTCHYSEPGERQCEGRAAEPDGEILLCTHHLALAFRAVRARQREFEMGVAAYMG